MEGRILSHYKVMKKLGGGRMGCGMLSVLNSLSGRRRELDQSPPTAPLGRPPSSLSTHHHVFRIPHSSRESRATTERAARVAARQIDQSSPTLLTYFSGET